LANWVRSSVAAGAPELIAELGGDWRTLFREAGLPIDALADPSTPIGVAAFARLLDSATRALDCEAFGLRLAQRQTFSLFGPLHRLFESAQTIEALLQDIADFFPLHTHGAIVGLARASGGVMTTYEPASDIGLAHRQLVELGFGVLIKEIRRHAPRWEPDIIRMRHGRPEDMRWHRRYLGSNIDFDADCNGVFVEAALLRRPTQEGSVAVHDALRIKYEAVSESAQNSAAAGVEKIVRALLPSALADVATAASLLRTSKRTLQRRLAAEGASFDRIVDAVRADLALCYLRESRLSVAQIAEVLQFSETSAFSRAFSRWYGVSPREAPKRRTLWNR
jgi:AraC-like DNA-binding protein